MAIKGNPIDAPKGFSEELPKLLRVAGAPICIGGKSVSNSVAPAFRLAAPDHPWRLSLPANMSPTAAAKLV